MISSNELAHLKFEELNTSDQFSIEVKDFNNLGYEYTPVVHWHDHIECEIIINGEARNIQNGREYLLHKGSAYLSSRYDCHVLFPGEQLICINIKIQNDFLYPDVVDLLTLFNGDIHCTLDEEQLSYASKQINRIIACSEAPDKINNMIVKAILTELLLTILKNSKVLSDTTPKKLRLIIKYINENLSKDISLNQIADEFSMSANYLGQLFKKTLYTSYNDYLNKIRIKYACHLLESNELPIKSVATLSGYKSLEYFYHTFKKYMLMTPYQYQKAYIRAETI